MDIRTVEKRWQAEWSQAKAFEAAPKKGVPKFFMTIPYPYISGSLHIGHSRVAIEADVYSRYMRMTGKNTLYPIAFHISGTPVLGIALAIKEGDAKKIELYKDYVRPYVKNEKEVTAVVKTFADPQKIVDFFVPKMIEEFSSLGIGVDWRRSYTSGSPCHQALVEWQFRNYEKKKYLVQGKHPILYSLTLKNAVGEDDISEGDTDPVEAQQFTLLKFKYGDEFIVAATLRPETMYGQTNMWANPDASYVRAKVGKETWLISKECAEKLTHQDKTVKIIGEVAGKEVMGKTCFAPFVEREIPILPASFCDPDIGTGFVTCVPSDAPYDYIALKELQDNPGACKKQGVDPAMVKAIKLIPIINSKGYGEFPAIEICQKMGITSLTQHEKLDEATQEIYKTGFHTGTMRGNCGPFSGMGVQQAKESMRNALIKEGRGDIFYETSRKAKSRDGGKVIVAVLDKQWFLDFNAKGWKTLASKALGSCELWPAKYRKQFEDVFAWLDKRPCARLRGLGTRLPQDTKWVIESLSDSTIYMSLYPIAHIINSKNIGKEQMNDAFFDFVMNCNGTAAAASKATGINAALLQQMQDEWHYWYPFDQRHTFTAHLSNHLSFMFFAHTACFDEKHWPKRISFHGMVVSEGEKMSKSKGNVITLLTVRERFGADPFRAFMCNSTSVDSTFNWQTEAVEGMRKHIDGIADLLQGIQQAPKTKPDKSIKVFMSKTERCIKQATECLAKMDLRSYSTILLHEMLTNYKKALKSGANIDALNNYVGNKWVAMLAPLCPHIAEELWHVNKANKGFVSHAAWPVADETLIDDAAEFGEAVVDTLVDDITTVMQLAKVEKPKNITVIVSPAWKFDLLRIIKQKLQETRNPGDIIKAIMATPLRQYGQDIMKLVPKLIDKMPAVILDEQTELQALQAAAPVITERFGCPITIIKASESKDAKVRVAMPGKPAILVN